MKRSCPLLLTAWLCLPACGVDLPNADVSFQQRHSVLGGEIATSDPAVVGVGFKQQGVYTSHCTGVLIGPKTILTANHCANQGIHFGTGPNDHPYAIFGTREDMPLFVVHVVKEVPNPARIPMNRDDFAVMELEREVTTVQPLALSDVPFSQADVGKDFRHVGFGLDDPNAQSGIGVKRTVTHAITGVSEFLLQSGDNMKATCGGDSGGPSLMVTPGSPMERVVGIVSWGTGVCGNGWDGRVDKAWTWIKTEMNKWEKPTCEKDLRCVAGCMTQDPDCKAMGEVCSEPTDCLSGVCGVGATERYCTTACASHAECPLDMNCESGGCVKRLVANEVSAEPLVSFSGKMPKGCSSVPGAWGWVAVVAALIRRSRFRPRGVDPQ